MLNTLLPAGDPGKGGIPALHGGIQELLHPCNQPGVLLRIYRI